MSVLFLPPSLLCEPGEARISSRYIDPPASYRGSGLAWIPTSHATSLCHTNPTGGFPSCLSSPSLRHFFVNPETPGVHRAASIPQPRTVARVQRGSQHHTQHSFARPSPLLGFISSVLPIPPLLLCELGEARSPIEPCALSTLCLSIPHLPCPSPGRDCQAAPGLQYVLEMPHDDFPVGTLGM